MSGIIGSSANMKSGVVGRFEPSVLQVVTESSNANYNGNENSWQTAFTKAITPKSANSKINVRLMIHMHVNPNNNHGSTWSIQEGGSIVGDGGTLFGARIDAYLSGNIYWITSTFSGETWVNNTALTTRTFQAKWTNSQQDITGIAHEKGHFNMDTGTAPAILQMIEYAL